MSIKTANSKGGSRQQLVGLRGAGPNSNVVVKDSGGQILRTESPTGQVLTVFKPKARRR